MSSSTVATAVTIRLFCSDVIASESENVISTLLSVRSDRRKTPEKYGSIARTAIAPTGRMQLNRMNRRTARNPAARVKVRRPGVHRRGDFGPMVMKQIGRAWCRERGSLKEASWECEEIYKKKYIIR